MRCEHVYPNCYQVATGHATWDRDQRVGATGDVLARRRGAA
jgi:hypothetical protein